MVNRPADEKKPTITSNEIMRMKTSTIREKVVAVVNQIPEERLPQILHLDISLSSRFAIFQKKTDKITNFAGCWKDMPEDLYHDFVNEISQRRKSAFSRRRNLDANIG